MHSELPKFPAVRQADKADYCIIRDCNKSILQEIESQRLKNKNGESTTKNTNLQTHNHYPGHDDIDLHGQQQTVQQTQ